MKALIAAFRELTSLFVDDGELALGILAIVVLAAALRIVAPEQSFAAAGILLFGSLGLLVASILRGARR